MSTVELTVRQQQVLDFMRVFLQTNDQMATNRAIADAFGWVSTNAADEVQKILERKGCLQRNELGNRMFARLGTS